MRKRERFLVKLLRSSALLVPQGGIVMPLKEKQARRSAELWRRVMREGRSVDEVAREFSIAPTRLERLLIAFGRRRVRIS
jgi:hypothetical protein